MPSLCEIQKGKVCNLAFEYGLEYFSENGEAEISFIKNNKRITVWITGFNRYTVGVLRFGKGKDQFSKKCSFKIVENIFRKQ